MDRDAARKREAGFLAREGDAAAVYRCDAGAMADRSVPLEQARLAGESPIVSGYDLIATGPIMRGADALAVLEEYRANGFARPGDVVSFKQDGVSILDKVLQKLVKQIRNEDLRRDKTTFGIVDAQSVQNADTAEEKGYDAGKKYQESNVTL